ncbi:hypothetical protein J3459_015068 [Metarhizium acridum]|nr:hypothetical protein J3459_015068 [Metarhizium acridum]
MLLQAPLLGGDAAILGQHGSRPGSGGPNDTKQTPVRAFERGTTCSKANPLTPVPRSFSSPAPANQEPAVAAGQKEYLSHPSRPKRGRLVFQAPRLLLKVNAAPIPPTSFLPKYNHPSSSRGHQTACSRPC